MRYSRYLTYFFFFTVLLLIDRTTKSLALIALNEPVCLVEPFLTGILDYNRGVAWGIFFFEENQLFLILTCVIALVILLLMHYTFNRLLAGKLILGETLLLAGALSNLFDRIIYGGVIDFILLSYNSWSWPLFNVADVYIVMGAGMLIIQEIQRD